MPTCDLCGASAADADPVAALSWTTSVEHGRRLAYCDACSRQHLRSLEGKLDAEHF